MIKSVVIDFHIGESIGVISHEDFEIKGVVTFDTSIDIILSDISQDRVQQLKDLYKSHPEVRIVDVPVGDIVIVVSNKQLVQTTIKYKL